MKIFKILKKTSFASAERKNEKLVADQANVLKGDFKCFAILDMVPDLIAILNAERQVIFANRALLDLLKVKDASLILGLRPGEILNCSHADNDSGGCGTTDYCRYCGAVNAILTAQNCHLSDQRDCEIITKTNDAYNLRVWTFPLKGGDKYLYTLLIIQNIADEIHRNLMEHTFFHDIINIGGGLYGMLEIIKDNSDDFKKHHQLLQDMTGELLDEICFQRDLLQGEEGGILITWKSVSNIEVISSAAAMLNKHGVASDKHIETIAQQSDEVQFETDKRLLMRILINMLKNALEASAPDETVLLKTASSQEKVVFEVHNNCFIPESVQKRIFNRAFSTKGKGRGLGTYSMKLLTEDYLQGKVYFISDPESGTSFFVELPIEPTIKEGDLTGDVYF